MVPTAAPQAAQSTSTQAAPAMHPPAMQQTVVVPTTQDPPATQQTVVPTTQHLPALQQAAASSRPSFATTPVFWHLGLSQLALSLHRYVHPGCVGPPTWLAFNGPLGGKWGGVLARGQQ